MFMAIRAILTGEMTIFTGLATGKGFVFTTRVANSIWHLVLRFWFQKTVVLSFRLVKGFLPQDVYSEPGGVGGGFNPGIRS